MESTKFKAVLGILRLSMGLVFLWAFFDKLLGWGFATVPEKSWLAGGSPTTGFLANAVHGPFADFFHSLAGNPLVDWLFMLGLLAVGVTLTLGVCVRLGSLAGFLMMLLMYLAIGIQPENHPFIDDHFINALVMLLLMFSAPGKYFGLGRQWLNTSLVQKYSFLK
jgi:thiosulfate dehydrogenase (quinone) large subunit